MDKVDTIGHHRGNPEFPGSPVSIDRTGPQLKEKGFLLGKSPKKPQIRGNDKELTQVLPFQGIEKREVFIHVALGNEAAQRAVPLAGSGKDNCRIPCLVIQQGPHNESNPVLLSSLSLMDQAVEAIGVGNGQGVNASFPGRRKKRFRRGSPLVEAVVGMDVEMKHDVHRAAVRSGVRSQTSGGEWTWNNPRAAC